MDLNKNIPSEEQPFGNMLLPLMLSENQDMDPMMLMLLMNQNGAGFDMSNPMMMYLALSSSSEDKNMLPLLMMMTGAASTPQEHKCTCHEHCNTRGCDTCEDEHPAQ
jgi:hypothetical protein